jgi:hypothetical protein
MNELLPKLVPLKGRFDSIHQSLVDCKYYDDDIETNGPKLRFGIAIANTGKGPLHIILGDVKSENGEKIAPAKQRIFNDNGEFRDVDVGYFKLHEELGHHHWHYKGLASLELLNKDSEVAAYSKKDSYCVVDVFKYRDLPNTPESAKFLFDACEQKTEIGISVGWADYYKKFTDLQSIDLNEVKSGIYSLRFKIERTKLIHEESEPVSLKINIDKEKGEAMILEQEL